MEAVADVRAGSHPVNVTYATDVVNLGPWHWRVRTSEFTRSGRVLSTRYHPRRFWTRAAAEREAAEIVAVRMSALRASRAHLTAVDDDD